MTGVIQVEKILQLQKAACLQKEAASQGDGKTLSGKRKEQSTSNPTTQKLEIIQRIQL